MLKKVWKLTDRADEGAIKSLADSLNISPVLAELLVKRSAHNFYTAKAFFRPSLDELHDPFLMDGMDIASLRIINALANNEKIYVYGDYDVDGTCSAALMYLFLKELGADPGIYIPNRLTDGYGITKSGIDFIKEKGASLIISVDCGITAVEEAAYAKSIGIEMIISDHHQPGYKIPEAYAVLDPIKPGCKYPFKFLSGAGVAFKLAQAISKRIGKSDLPLKYLDLVAIAGAADIVALTGENRVLVKTGLDQINIEPRPGILALIKSAGLDAGNLTAGQIVFYIAPRINAVGRMGEATPAVELFTSETKEKAEYYAGVLEGENYQRRKIDEMTFSHAVSVVEETVDLDEERAIVLHEENWHPGVIGIVASRLVEKYYRPTVMLTTVDGVAKGSARSINGFNIYDALKQCEDLLVQFGGHEAAAGLAIEVDKLTEFKRRFNEIVKIKISSQDVFPEIVIDSKISFSEITPKFLRILDQFAPFGPGNMRPVFMTENVELFYNPKIVGSNHLIMSLKQKDSDKVFDSIGYNLGGYMQQINRAEDLIDVVFTIEKSVRDGRTFPQFRLKDIAVNRGAKINGIKKEVENINLGAV